VIFIEVIRGVPLIVWLFTASLLLNYFLPPGTNFDLMLRVIIMVTLFASAYIAEVVRGGLAALPRGQYEGADSLGLDYWQSMRLIILPQALKISIPGIVNTFIGLFKDTTLVVFIGLLDPIGLSNAIRATTDWNGIYWELFIFIGLCFFVCCYSMSRYSQWLERKLGPIIAKEARPWLKHKPILPRTRDRPLQMKVSDEVAIEIQNMNKWYGTFHVLRDIDLTVNRGRADRHLRAVRVGQVDADPLHQRAGGASAGLDRRRRHASVERPQEHRPDPVRGRDGVPALQPVPASDDPGELHAGADLGPQDAQEGSRETAMYFLDKVKIPEQALKYPGQLSGGQQQRVAIARSLCMRPRSCCSTSRPRRSTRR
jgi:ABC-type amino acid transport system permease subunit